MAELIPPFRCWLVYPCSDLLGGESWERDPDGRQYTALADARTQALGLAELNPGARVVVHDGLGRPVLDHWEKTANGYRLGSAAELERAGARWLLRYAGVEIKLPRRATFDHAETELRRRGFAC